MLNTIADIEQLNFEAFRQLNKHVRSIRQIFSESLKEMKSLQAFDRCPQKNDVYVRQVQSILDLLDASSQELRTLQTVERLPKEKDIYLRQVTNIHELLNVSLYELKSLQTIDRRPQENDIYLRQVQNIHQLLNASIQEMRSLQTFDRRPSGIDKCIKDIQSVEMKNENDTFSTGIHGHNISTTSQTQIPWIVINAVAATHLGCYDEFGTDEVFVRATKVRITDLSSLAPDGCRERCRENLIYSYAALWNGTYCYCTAAMTKGQVAPINDSLCNIPCPGDEVEFCGGPGDSYYFSVYSVCPRGLHGRNCTKMCNCKDNESCTVFGLCPTDECASGWKMNTTDPNRKRCSEDFSDGTYLGCYHEFGDQVAFARESATTSSSLTLRRCREECRKDLKYSFAGLWKGSYCYCAVEMAEGQLARVNNSFCYKPCSGEKTAWCGGPGLSLYYGVYSVCPSGFYGRSCTTICHCKDNRNCTVYGGCPGDECAVGWKLNNAEVNRRSCSIDVDECQIKCKSANSINCHNCNSALRRKCNNVIGSFSCICEDGFEEINKHCADINECARVRHECNHNCTNTEGSYNCYCRSGYELQGNFYCRDIDECARRSHRCSHHCSNTDGSYSCYCQSGYELHNQTQCRDIDECARSYQCDHFCSNTDGSYSCHCPSGYELYNRFHCRRYQ